MLLDMPYGRVLSLGVGVQSSFLALAMTDKYRIDKVYNKLKGAVVIFADTGSEKPKTMDYWANVVEPELKASDIEYYVVKSDEGELLDYYRRNDKIPFRRYRGCTDMFKLQPIRNKLKELWPDYHRDHPVEMILGITTDEITRVKDSRVKYIKNIFTLVDLDYSRDSLYGYYEEWGLEPPVKSGCYCCPFARPSEIVEFGREYPKLIELVIDMEENAIAKNYKQKGPTGYKMQLLNGKYTVKQLIEADKEQTGLDEWWSDFDEDDECEGACFL